jgi:hypothetical protein
MPSIEFGFKIIRDMTKEEIIEELVASQRVIMEAQTLDCLKQHLIHFRTVAVQKRLCEEADLEPTVFGGLLGRGDDD